MNIEEIRLLCLSLKGTSEELPFDETTLVFKVMNKIFLLTSLNKPLYVNVKCDPEKAIDLRERYGAVLPGYHMNKKHWNTISVDGSVSDHLIKEWILHSYDLVIKGLPARDRKALTEE